MGWKKKRGTNKKRGGERKESHPPFPACSPMPLRLCRWSRDGCAGGCGWALGGGSSGGAWWGEQRCISPGSAPGAWESARGSRPRSPGALGMSAAGAGPAQGAFNQKHQVNTFFQHDWRRLQMGGQAPLPRGIQDRAASALDNCPVCLLLLCWPWDSALDTGVARGISP